MKKRWTKKDVLKAIRTKNDDVEVKVQVNAFFIKALEKKYKPTRGEYIVKFKKMKGFKKEEGFYMKDGLLRVIVSNKEKSKNDGYSAKIDPAKKTFYSKLQILVLVLNRNDMESAIVGYDLPTSVRKREDAAKSTAELFNTLFKKKSKKNTKK